jgi:DNA-binding transcriptional LysR family regulator
MELRHLRYFQSVAEALNFTRAATQLRIAQPALSRQVQDLEEELGVDLLVRSPRGVTLTAEGKLFLGEVRDLLKRADEAVEKVRALARGEFGELHVGYAPSPSSEVLPPALTAFQKAAPRVRVVLHDLASQEMLAGLRDGTLDLAITVQQEDEPPAGIEFEEVRRYPLCVAMAPSHPLARKKSVSLHEIMKHPLIGLRRRDYGEYYGILERVFAPLGETPKVAVECDSSSSMLTELETGNGIAIVTTFFRHAAGKRVVFRPIANSTECLSVGIAHASASDLAPAAGKFCEMLRDTSR